jgi:hypothetical protein
LGPFFAWAMATDGRPLELQLATIEAADLLLRTEKVVIIPLSVPANEPVPLLAAAPLPGISNLTRPLAATEPPTLLTVVTELPEDSWGDVFHLVVNVPVTVVRDGSPRGPIRLLQPFSSPWVSEKVPVTVPLVTVNPATLLLQSVNFAFILVTIVPAGSLEMIVGLNAAEPVTCWQEIVSLAAFIMGAPASAMLPVATMRPGGMAPATAINSNLRIMFALFSLVEVR